MRSLAIDPLADASPSGFPSSGDDFDSFLDAQKLLDETFADRESWLTKSIHTVASMGKFNSDRSVAQYCEEIWNVEPLPVPTDYKG